MGKVHNASDSNYLYYFIAVFFQILEHALLMNDCGTSRYSVWNIESVLK
jgi:hypothetical protein